MILYPAIDLKDGAVVRLRRGEMGEATVFNRGQHNDGLPTGVERILGDRRGDLAALKGRRWDAVVRSTLAPVPSSARPDNLILRQVMTVPMSDRIDAGLVPGPPDKRVIRGNAPVVAQPHDFTRVVIGILRTSDLRT